MCNLQLDDLIPAQDRLLTLNEVRKALGTSYPTLRKMIAQGHITTIRVGNTHKISPAELQRFLTHSSNYVTNPQPA